MEALVNVSLQPSVLKAAVLSYAELVPGQIISGTVSVDMLCSVCKNMVMAEAVRVGHDRG